MDSPIQLWENSLTASLEADGILTVQLLQCDTPSSITGRIYPRVEVQRAIDVYMKKPAPHLGFLDNGTTNHMDLERVSHEVLSLEIDDSGSVVGKIKLYNTPLGSIVRQVVESVGLDGFRCSPIMTGCVDTTARIVRDLTIHATTIINKG